MQLKCKAYCPKALDHSEVGDFFPLEFHQGSATCLCAQPLPRVTRCNCLQLCLVSRSSGYFVFAYIFTRITNVCSLLCCRRYSH